MKGIHQVVRGLAIACIPLLALGFIVLLGILVLFCVDVCPADIAGTLASTVLLPVSRSGVLLDAILLVALVMWALFARYFREIAPRGLWMVSVIGFPVILVAGFLGAFISSGFHLLPATSDQFSRWTGPVLLAWLVLLPWAILTVVAAFTPKKSS